VDQGSEIYAKSRVRLHIERLLTSVNEVFTNRRVGVVTLLTLHNIIILICRVSIVGIPNQGR
jgi:hypothetical protein